MEIQLRVAPLPYLMGVHRWLLSLPHRRLKKTYLYLFSESDWVIYSIEVEGFLPPLTNPFIWSTGLKHLLMRLPMRRRARLPQAAISNGLCPHHFRI